MDGKALHFVLPTHKAQRKKLRWEANELGLLLLFTNLATVALPVFLHLCLQWAGYDGVISGTVSPVLYYCMMGTTFTLCFLVPGMLYLKAKRQSVLSVLPTHKIRPDVFVALCFLGCGAALLCNFPAEWLSSFFQFLLPASTLSFPSASGYLPAVEPAVPGVAMVLAYIRATVLPAFFEEFVFRGIALQGLRKFGDTFAIFASAALFGLFHGNFSQNIFAFFVGLVFGYLVVRTGQIWLSIAVHFGNNALASLSELKGFFATEQSYYFFHDCFYYGILLLGAFSALYLLWRKRSFFLPQNFTHPSLALGSRVAAFFTAPCMWLAILYCLFETWLSFSL